MSSLSVLNTASSIAASNQTTNVEQKTASEKAAADAEKKKTDFLKLLLTQLENQNPLDPMDTDEWTAQLTRYSILEQGIETNANLEVTNDLLTKNSNNTTLSYIGEEVETSSNTAPSQDGAAKWSYSIDGTARDVTLTVLDSNGNIISVEDGDISAGVHDYALDTASLGVEEGEPLELVIAARDAEEEALDSNVTATAKVDGVWTNDTSTFLTSGGVSYRIEDILKVASKSQGGAT